jgi:hypothetical protein
LSQRFQITDAEVVLTPEREERRQDPGDFSFGREIHRKMTNDE